MPCLVHRSISVILTLATLGCGLASAQGTGTVASPIIKPGAYLSLAGAMARDNDDAGFAHRLDYRYAVTDTVRLSAIAVFNDGGRRDYRFRRLALEAMTQFVSSETGWNSALQVRGRVPDGNDGAARVRLAWLNRWRPAERLELRFIGLAAKELGTHSDPGFALETRSEVTWQTDMDVRIGAQIFNRYNTTANLGTFDSQRHSVGGVVKGNLTDRVSYRVNALTGLSAKATDFELRFRLRTRL